MSLFKRHIGRRVAVVGTGVAMLVLGLQGPASAVVGISSFAPVSGPVGCVVVLTGTDFNNPTVTAVDFNGTAASFVIKSGTEIWTAVPAGASNGPITVTNSAGQTASTATGFTVTSGAGDCAPTIESFTPTCGPAGTDVTITGTNLLKSTTAGGDVEFAPYLVTATPVTGAAVSPTQISVNVPAGAADGPITVMTFGATGGTVISTATFDAGVCVTGMAPTAGEVGTTVTITGIGIGTATAVTFSTNVPATFTVLSNTETEDQISTTVPVGAVDGPITITTPDGTAMTAPFDVGGGGVTHARSVTLALKKHLRAKGTVSVDDGFTDCAAGVPVKIQRKTSSGWKTVKSTTTSATGAYSVKIKDKPGRYRARAPRVELNAGADICLKATSPIRKHRH